jgi:lysozyme family protein
LSSAEPSRRKQQPVIRSNALSECKKFIQNLTAHGAFASTKLEWPCQVPWVFITNVSAAMDLEHVNN